MGPPELSAEQRRRLVGKLVRVCAARAGGSFLALVRRADPRGATVQRPGKPWARSTSAKFCGPLLRVWWPEVEGVLDRRRRPPNQVVPLRAYLSRGR